MDTLPASHPRASRGFITPKQIERYPFVALKPEDTVSVRLYAICKNKGVQLRTVIERAYRIRSCEMRSGIGIAILNPITTLDYLRAGLVFRRFSERFDFAALTAYLTGQAHSPLVQALLPAMREQLATDMDMLQEQMQPASWRAAPYSFGPAGPAAD